MLKVMGIVLIIGSCVAVGMVGKKELALRIRSLVASIGAVDYIYSELYFRQSTLGCIIEWLSNNARSPMKEIFSILQKDMQNGKNLSLSYYWLKAFKENGQIAGLDKEDISILCDLSMFMGKYDVDAQLKQLLYTKKQLEENLQEAKANFRQKGNLYRTLGIAVGALIVLILV